MFAFLQESVSVAMGQEEVNILAKNVLIAMALAFAQRALIRCIKLTVIPVPDPGKYLDEG
jgi:hypothetical protein